MNNVDLQLVRSDSKTYTINVTNNGVAQDISGWSLYFTVKNDYEDADVDAIISVDVTFPSNASSVAGVGYLPITSDDSDVALGNYKYDMKLISNVSTKQTFARGKYNIIPTARLS